MYRMKILNYIAAILIVLGFSFSQSASAQTDSLKHKNAYYEEIVEVGGVIYTQVPHPQTGAMAAAPVPYAAIQILGTNRGAYANIDGMFSVVVKKGQKIKITSVGYAETIVEIPADFKGNRWAISIQLEAVSIDLETITVLPWPSRHNLTAEFLAMAPSEALQMQTVANENLKERELLAMQNSFKQDSKEAASYYLAKQSRSYMNAGQMPSMPVFNPLAWASFLKQQKDKKKDKEKADKEKY